MTRKKADKASRIAIIVAIIGAVSVIVAAILRAPFFSDWLGGLKKPKEIQVAVRVSDSSGASVSGANVLFFFEGGPLSDFTDVNGVVNFGISPSDDTDVRLVVEKDQFEIYERAIGLPQDSAINVRLKKSNLEAGSIIVRVVDDETSIVISGAHVLLIVGGDVYEQFTDSNGIAKFTLAFPGGKIDAQMSISTDAYEIKDLNVTLLPNRVQDIRLNRRTETAEVLFFSEVTPVPQATDVLVRSLPLTAMSAVSGISAELYEISRFQNTLTIRLRFMNSGQEDISLWLTSMSHLLDEATHKSYDVVERSTHTIENIPAGGELLVWIKFDIPAEDSPQHLSLILGEGILFDHLPIPQD